MDPVSCTPHPIHAHPHTLSSAASHGAPSTPSLGLEQPWTVALPGEVPSLRPQPLSHTTEAPLANCCFKEKKKIKGIIA